MYSTYTRIVYVRIPSQKAPRAKHCRLSHGPPAITALSDEEEDGTVVKIDDKECSKEQEDRQIQQPSSSIPKIQPSSPEMTLQSKSNKTQQSSSPASSRPSSPSPPRLNLGDISNVLARRHKEEKSYLQKKVDAL